MNATCYVLEFAPVNSASAPNMDVVRVYRRKLNPTTGTRVPLACRVSQVSSTENLLHSMRGAEVTHRVYFNTNPNLREENRLEINGLQYILTGVPTNASQAGRLWQVDVKVITQQNQLAKVLE